MKKKLPALLLCLCLTVPLAACGQPAAQGTESLPPEGSPGTGASAATNAPVPAPSPTPEPTEPPVPDPEEEVAEQVFDGYVVRNSCAIIQTEEKSFELSGDYDAMVIPGTLESLTISDYRWDAIYYEGTPEQFQKLGIHRWDGAVFVGTWETAAYADRFFAGYRAADPADLDGEYVYYGAKSRVFPTPVYYYSETEPTEPGMWWRYDEQGLPAVWENSLKYDPEIHPSETVVIRNDYAFIKDGEESIALLGYYDVVVLPVSVNRIRLEGKMRTVFYQGMPEQFKEIECYCGDLQAWADRAFMGYSGREYIGYFGFQPTPVYYYSETEPAEPGMYWRYDETGFPVLWENNLEFDPIPTISLSENVTLRGPYAIVRDGVEQVEESLTNIYDGVVIPVSVKSIRLEDLWVAVFYRGTPEQFQKIRCYTNKYVAWADRAFMGYANRSGDIDGKYEYIGASGFHNRPVYYYSETEPAEPGMYWRYDANGFPVPWENNLEFDNETKPAPGGIYWDYGQGLPAVSGSGVKYDPGAVVIIGSDAVIIDTGSLERYVGVVIPASIERISLGHRVGAVFYEGTPEQFKKVECFFAYTVAWADQAFMGYSNRDGNINGEYEYREFFGFYPTPVYYYSETEPASEGMYWHYGADGSPVVWQ